MDEISATQVRSILAASGSPHAQKAELSPRERLYVTGNTGATFAADSSFSTTWGTISPGSTADCPKEQTVGQCLMSRADHHRERTRELVDAYMNVPRALLEAPVSSVRSLIKYL